MNGVAAISRPVAALTLRSILSGRRLAALGLLNLLPIAGVLLARDDADPLRIYARTFGNLHLPLIVALVSLALAGSAISDERDDGTIVYLTQTPLSRLSIASAKVVAVWLGTLLVSLPSTLVMLMAAARADGSLLWTLAGTLLVAFAYAGAFSWLALRMRRAMIAGLAYIVAWEGSIASFAASAKRLSVSAYGRVLGQEGAPTSAWRGVAPNATLTAVIVLIAFGLLGIWASARRLDRMELP